MTLGEDLYELFGRYGAIRQIRLGNTPQTRGTAYIVFEEMGDAKSALTNLNGFHLQERYIVGTYAEKLIQFYTMTRAKFQGMEHCRSAKRNYYVPSSVMV